MSYFFCTHYLNDAEYVLNKHFNDFILRIGFQNTNLNYGKIKKTLSRRKNQTYPNIPTTIESICTQFKDPKIMEKYGFNLENDAKFYVDTIIESDYAYTIFASKFVIDFVEENIEPKFRNYLMDGTFDSLPNGFYQLLIISIEYRNDVSNNSFAK